MTRMPRDTQLDRKADDAKEQQLRQALQLLRDALPRQAIADERYWRWHRRVTEFLDTLP